MFKLTAAERDRRWNLVRSEMEKRKLYCLFIYGSFGIFRDANQNLQYLTNVNSEGYLIFPLEQEPTLYSFENGLDLTGGARLPGPSQHPGPDHDNRPDRIVLAEIRERP